jgi:FdhD protein
MAANSRNIQITQVREWEAGVSRTKTDYLAAEEPLEIRIGDSPVSVTMRTPGHDRELAAGFLFTEGLLASRMDLVSLEVATAPHVEEGADDAPNAMNNAVVARLAVGAAPDLERLQRHFFASSSCGVCGKATIDAVRSRTLTAPNPNFRIAANVLATLPETLRESQDVFDRTGGLHGAALFDSNGKLLVAREDIGRHNAVDKVIGWALLEDRVPLSDVALLVSGRGGFEIVQKAVAAGVPVVACVSAPSSLAVQLAREMRQTLVGFLRGERFVVYSGEERITPA